MTTEQRNRTNRDCKREFRDVQEIANRAGMGLSIQAGEYCLTIDDRRVYTSCLCDILGWINYIQQGGLR